MSYPWCGYCGDSANDFYVNLFMLQGLPVMLGRIFVGLELTAYFPWFDRISELLWYHWMLPTTILSEMWSWLFGSAGAGLSTTMLLHL